MISAKEILVRLKKLGTAQNRKVWSRHGAKDDYLGVSFAHLERLKKEINRTFKKDVPARHKLAMDLWDTKVCDAQILAIMLADPAALSKSKAKSMIKGVSFYLISNYLGGLFARTPFAIELMEEEMKSKKEYLCHNGYDILSTILKNKEPDLSKARCQKYLKSIEKNIHNSPNRAKNAMNWSMIALGVFRVDLRKDVLAAAKRIGRVEVDHGDTSCKTPDAIPYIQKAIKRQKS